MIITGEMHMKKTYIKGVVVFALIVGINAIMNKVLTPKIETSKYHYTLSASQLDLKKGAIYTVAATGDDATKIKWLSSDPQVATISKTGQVIAKKTGQTIISANVKSEFKDLIVNVTNTAKADVLIYSDSQVTPAASEVINKISIAKFKLTLSSNTYTYDGKAKKPKVQVETNDHKILVKNKDYTVKYAKNKKPGTAKVIVTGKNDYTGTLLGSFKIEKSSDENTSSTNTNNVAAKSDTLANDIATPSVPTENYTTSYQNTTLTPTTNYTYRPQSITPKKATKTTKPTTPKKKTETPKKNTNNSTSNKATSSNASNNSNSSASSSSSHASHTDRDTSGSSSHGTISDNTSENNSSTTTSNTNNTNNTTSSSSQTSSSSSTGNSPTESSSPSSSPSESDTTVIA